MPMRTRTAQPSRPGPLGIRMIEHLIPSSNVVKKTLCYKGVVLLLTFWSYCCYHATRKTISIVKTTLYHNCTGLTPPPGIPPGNDTWCDWAPFDGPNANALLGTLDSAFLFSYAFFMFISGIIAEHVNLRYFLTIGMILSGLANYFFGLAKVYNIHAFSYFVIVQIFGGIAQTTGWPGVLTVMGNWFGKRKRGVIFGVWNSHTSIGNIVGGLIASYYLTTDWSLSFIVPGIMMSLSGIVIFLFLPETPSSVGCSIATNLPRYTGINNDNNPIHGGYRKLSNTDGTSEDNSDSTSGSDDDTNPIDDETTPILQPNPDDKQAVGFFTALMIPGVLEFSLSLFFVKLVNYTFLYWLPGYIKISTSLDAQLSGDLATVFDIGGILGGIAAGIMTDLTGKSATTCAVMLVLSVPMLFIYQAFGAVSVNMSIILLFLVGILVNGPYALITTAVAAELGNHECLQGNNRAMATVASIIDGTGSIGAAVGPLLTGYVSVYGWEYVFYMLMGSCVVAVLLLLRLLISEYKKISRPVPVIEYP
ncbi:glucose-6-phosphate exchanger SLC37A2-like [Diaphorina citri]|uniref:Sugar phosphate exchanger 3 n=1 Tax=Diaphorina citri TaxID=121845 RepID=A0A1S3DHH1_DIACI|nr:glucose-6-phosphate exchanger SLC37A2-like [Diaphorina citri]XP_008481755.1 glucose-6-phosphate exchanger SLC37A2-like [Diaphorina citri]XP_008481758.2 glucose-6-phosphate exchanger SLC37A2-like [Diaphorina citri]